MYLLSKYKFLLIVSITFSINYYYLCIVQHFTECLHSVINRCAPMVERRREILQYSVGVMYKKPQTITLMSTEKCSPGGSVSDVCNYEPGDGRRKILKSNNITLLCKKKSEINFYKKWNIYHKGFSYNHASGRTDISGFQCRFIASRELKTISSERDGAIQEKGKHLTAFAHRSKPIVIVPS